MHNEIVNAKALILSKSPKLANYAHTGTQHQKLKTVCACCIGDLYDDAWFYAINAWTIDVILLKSGSKYLSILRRIMHMFYTASICKIRLTSCRKRKTADVHTKLTHRWIVVIKEINIYKVWYHFVSCDLSHTTICRLPIGMIAAAIERRKCVDDGSTGV